MNPIQVRLMAALLAVVTTSVTLRSVDALAKFESRAGQPIIVFEETVITGSRSSLFAEPALSSGSLASTRIDTGL